MILNSLLMQRWTFFAANTFSFLHEKGVKTSLSLVNEFTGTDVSLDKAAGGFRRGGGGVQKSSNRREKRV